MTPAKRGKGKKANVPKVPPIPSEQHAFMRWAQRLKRVLNIDIDIDKSAGQLICTVTGCREAVEHWDVPDDTCQACRGAKRPRVDQQPPNRVYFARLPLPRVEWYLPIVIDAVTAVFAVLKMSP